MTHPLESLPREIVDGIWPREERLYRGMVTTYHDDYEECPYSSAWGRPEGRTVKIVDGRFWGQHGVSNFWYWREVLSDGSLSETLLVGEMATRRRG